MPKLADPTLFPPAAPAADDAIMARTNAGGDKAFLLGNLAGLAPLVMAADQSAYYNGTTWATYSLTAVGRTFLAATTNAARLSAIGAADDTMVVHNFGAETIGGVKTCTAAWRWNLSTNGAISYAVGGTSPTIIGRFGDTTAGDTTSYRTDLRFGQGTLTLFLNDTASANAGNRGFQFTTTSLIPTTAGSGSTSLGSASNLFSTVYATNSTINTSDARLKTEPRQLRDAEFKAASAIARLPAVWRWIHRVEGDENCEPEGTEARKHFGPTVQAAIAVMEAHGLDPFAYSFICYDEWEAEPEQWHEWPDELDDDGNVIREAGRELVQAARQAGDRYSFRKEELLCFLSSALAVEVDQLRAALAAQATELASAMDLVQQLMERVAALEAKLTD